MPFYNFSPGQGGTPSQLMLDGEIVPGGWAWPGDTDASAFCRALSQCRDVDVIINSPGGDVFAGAMIYSMLKAHPHPVRVKIAGIAASAASVVAMAGDEILISPAGYMMIHNPWMHMAGDARAMEKAADDLREIGKGILAAYQLKTGMDEAALTALLDNETYMNAQSAVEMGFADGIWHGERFAAAPAAMMAGRNYAPQAVMARMQGNSERAAEGEHTPHPALRATFPSRGRLTETDPQAIADLDIEKRKRMAMGARAMKID